MHPDLYEDIRRTLEGLEKEMDENPLDSVLDVRRYSYAFQAAMYLQWFLDACLEGEGSE